jgi:hypothetical protein
MSRRKNRAERIKNIVILLLLVSAVFLGWESRLFGNTSVSLSVLTNPAEDKPAGSGSDEQPAGTKTIGEARPVSITVTDSTGAYYGVKYNLDDIDGIYENTVLIFQEALGTAQIPEATDESAWRAALRAPGVFFEYMSPVRLSVLDGWFGAEISGDWRTLSVRRLGVAVDGEPRLYFQDDETGTFYTADTAVLADSITKLTSLYAANTASFAYEILGAASLISPYALILPEQTDHPRLEAKNPLTGETLIKVLRKFGVSEHLKPIQLDAGVLAYPEDDFRIELSPNGTVNYKRTGSPEASSGPADESGAIELARQAVADSIAEYCGDGARVYFEEVRSGGPGSFEVLFTYVFAGGRVYLDQDGYAASVTITDGAISKMELRFRSFAVIGQVSGLLPEIQAAAASGGAFMLCYSDNGGTILEPAWVNVPHNS